MSWRWDTAASESIFILLNTQDAEKRDKLTERWRDNKLAELNFIGIVSALIAGCLTSTGSWPNILQDGNRQPWTVRACWYTGLLFSLTAILLAASQTIQLHRISAHRDALVRLRTLLGNETPDAKGLRHPKVVQAYFWQMAVWFLSLGVFCMLGGLFILVWDPTGADGDWWDDNAKVAVTVTVIGAICAATFIFTHTMVWWHSERKPPHRDMRGFSED